MEYVSRGIYLSDRITIKDILSVYFLGGHAASEKNLFRRIYFLKRIVSVLTTVKKPRIWHVLVLNKILKAAKLTGETDKTDPLKSPVDSMNEVIDFISVKTGKTQNEILENCTPEEMNRLYLSTVKERELKSISFEKLLIRTLPFTNATKRYY